MPTTTRDTASQAQDKEVVGCTVDFQAQASQEVYGIRNTGLRSRARVAVRVVLHQPAAPSRDGAQVHSWTQHGAARINLLGEKRRGTEEPAGQDCRDPTRAMSYELMDDVQEEKGNACDGFHTVHRR